MTVYNATMGTDYLRNALTNVNILGQDWILSVIVMFVVLLLITREFSKWSVFAFPVYILVGLIGFKTTLGVYAFLALLMAVSVIGVEALSELALASYRKVEDVTNIKSFGTANKDVIKRAKRDKAKTDMQTFKQGFTVEDPGSFEPRTIIGKMAKLKQDDVAQQVKRRGNFKPGMIKRIKERR